MADVLTPGPQTSEYRLTLRAAAILAAVFVAGKTLETVIFIMTNAQQVVITDVELGILAAALSGGAASYAASRTSAKNALSKADPTVLASLAGKIVEAAKK